MEQKLEALKMWMPKKVKNGLKKNRKNEEKQLDNQMIAIWGSPGSGKTLLAVKIATELSKKKKNTLIVFDDIFCPSIPTILPDLSNKSENKSLGNIFAAPNIDQDIILNNFITVFNSSYIALLGHQKGENPFTYPEYIQERAADLFLLLRHLVDYIIVDCSSIITESILTITALEFADKVIRLSTADFKGLSFFRSTLPLLGDTKFKAENHLKIVSNVKDYEAKDTIKNALKGDILLPHDKELERQFIEGKLFRGLKSKVYIKEMTKIMGEIIYE